ncbi:MAG TPA: adenylate/guanylate cyclase domain-containing protein [Stellaceae bacterium]|nr:adenylate/guanylate cyclase domain-containing protein [Stellaceae bacterium]
MARVSARRFATFLQRGTVYWLPLVLLGGMSLGRLVVPEFFGRLSLLAFDGFQRTVPRPPANLPVRIVAIDDKSIEQIGQWPWPRSKMAELVDKLREAGAGVVAFDILFSEPDRTSPKMLLPLLTRGGASEADAQRLLASMPDPDRDLAGAIAKLPVVLGYSLGDTAGGKPVLNKAGFAIASAKGENPLRFVDDYPQAVGDLSELQKAAAGNGFVNQHRHWDNVVRRMPLLFRLRGQAVPSLAAETLRVAAGAHSYIARGAGANAEKSFGENTGLTDIKIGPLVVPTDGSGRVWLYYSYTDPNQFISAADILAGHFDRRLIADNIVLIGATAAGLGELYATPLGTEVPGVEVHAQLIEQILQGSFLARPDWVVGGEILFAVLAGIILIVLMPRSGALAGAAVGAIAVAGVAAVSWFAFRDHHILVDPAFPIVVLVLVYLLAALLNQRHTEHRQREIRQAFSRYMSPQYVDLLARDPDKLVLGGELRTMTILFCDIRGFTTLSEGLGPQELTEYVNGFLTPMTEIVMAHHGTIDKYIGDCVMAFWNAPLDDPDHAKHAIYAAQEMRRRIIDLNASSAETARAAGVPHRPMRIGIGVNTGECCVGNFGSQQRFDYSIIGDPVNVAARLESLTKMYGVELILGEETALRLSEADLIELDLVTVKGKTRPVHIYTLPPQPIEEAQYRNRHAALLAAYRRRDWEGALGLLSDEVLAAESEMAPVYELFRERINQLQAEALPSDWDGVFIAAEK